MHRFTLVLITLTAIILTVAPVAAQGTVNCVANADTYLRSLYPNNNYGDSTVLDAGRTGTGHPYRSLLNFDTSTILPDGQYATSVMLHFTTSAWYTGGDDSIIGVFEVTGPWTESGATWNNSAGLLGSQIGSDTIIVTGDAPATVTFDVTSAWQESANFDIYLAMTNEDTGTGRWQPYSREYSSGSNAPYLEISHSPEPCSMALASLALGMIGFAARRRRKEDE